MDALFALGVFFGGLGAFFAGSAAIWWVSREAKRRSDPRDGSGAQG